MNSHVNTQEIRALLEKATPGPWQWTPGDGQPQIEGSVEAPDMNPVLIAHGCGNELATAAGVTGCMPENLNDELRACPLHPTAPDRALIVALRNAAPSMIEELEQARVRIAELEDDAKRLNGLLAFALQGLDAVPRSYGLWITHTEKIRDELAPRKQGAEL